jgi:hypothetical protein
MEKSKLPELKVVSFVTALEQSELNRIGGGDAGDEGHSTPYCSFNEICPTSTACSTSDENQGISCDTACS